MNKQNCSYLDEYLEGALSSEMIIQFEAHLQQCESCAEMVTKDKKLSESFTKMRFQEMPDLIDLNIRSVLNSVVIQDESEMTPAGDDLMTIHRASRLLGITVQDTLDLLPVLPTVEIGDHIMVQKSVLLRFMQERELAARLDSIKERESESFPYRFD